MSKPVYDGEVIYSFAFGYFGDELDNDDMTELRMICARRAYRDVCRTLTFNKHIDQNYHDLFCEKISEWIVKQINDLLNSQGYKAFDAKHRYICNNILSMAKSAKTENDIPILVVKEVSDDSKKSSNNDKGKTKNDGETFHYGQAQKWLNMTLKYMWMAGDKGKVENYLHIPVDRYILEAVYQKYDDKEKIKLSKYNPNSPLYVSWSSWSEDDYNTFREIVLKLYNGEKGEKQIPLVWEDKQWREIAKKENGCKKNRLKKLKEKNEKYIKF